MKTRRGLTLLEILISLMVLGLGMAALASLFPLGIDMASEADKDTQSGILAMSARTKIIAARYVERLAGDNSLGGGGANAFFAPGCTDLTDLDPATDTGASHALLIDPVGAARFVALAPANRYIAGEADILWALGDLPRFPLFRQSGPDYSSDFTNDITPANAAAVATITKPCVDSVLRMDISATDATTRANAWEIGGWPDGLVWLQADLEGTGRYSPAPQMSGATVLRDAHGNALLQQQENYCWMAVVQMPDIQNPRVFNIRIAVFRNRRFSLEAERRFTTTVVSSGQNPVVKIQWPITDDAGTANLAENQAPEARSGGYVLDAGERRGYFYRIAKVGTVDVENISGTDYFVQQLTLESPLRAASPELVVMPGVAEVFESTFTLSE